MNYSEALEYIHSINWEFCKPGLERIGALCEGLSHPERGLKFIHVAGTNGKGSFCAMTERILREAGYKTGLFTSPYVRFFNERMMYCGEPISDGELAEICTYVKPVADGMTEKPTEFELITAIAFEYFRRKNAMWLYLRQAWADVLILRILSKIRRFSVTGVALDHTAYLGDTVEKSREKRDYKAGLSRSARWYRPCRPQSGGNLCGKEKSRF